MRLVERSLWASAREVFRRCSRYALAGLALAAGGGSSVWAATGSVDIDLSSSVSAMELVVGTSCPLPPPPGLGGPGPDSYSWGATTFTTGDSAGNYVFEVTALGAMDDPDLLLYAGANGFDPGAPAGNYIDCALDFGFENPMFPRLVSALTANTSYTVVVIVPKVAPAGTLNATLGLGRQPTITLDNLTVPLGATSQSMVAISNSDGAIRYASQFPGVAQVEPNSGAVTPVSQGSTQVAAIQAAQGGSGEFGSGFAEATLTISTATSPPTITSPTSSSVTVSSATLGGSVTNDGGATISDRGVVVSRTSDNATPEIGGSGVIQRSTGGTTGALTVTVDGLVAGTAYSFRAYASNAQGTSYTQVQSFSTSAALSFSTQPAFVSSTSSTVTVTFRASGIGDNVRVGAFTSAAPAPSSAAIIAGTGTQGTAPAKVATTASDQSMTITGLTPGTPYDVYAALEGSAVVSGKLSVSTQAGLPPQSITFDDNPGPLQVIASDAFVGAEASSGLPVTYDTASTTVCTVGPTDGRLALFGIGDCVITAFQDGEGTFEPAQETQTIQIVRAQQPLVFNTPLSVGLSQSPLTVEVKGGFSGNPVEIASLTPAVCTGMGVGTVELELVSSGDCILGADQAETSLFAPGRNEAVIEVLASPPRIPGIPQGLVVTPRVGSATLEIAPPVDNGGARISRYIWTATPTSGEAVRGSCAAVPTASCEAVAGLVAGDSYVFSVAAVNAAGVGPSRSADSASTLLLPAPTQTLALRVLDVANDSVDIGWDPVPGSSVRYRVEADLSNGGVFSQVGEPTPSSKVEVSLLPPDTPVSIRVTAINQNDLDLTLPAVIEARTTFVEGAVPTLQFVNVTRTHFPRKFVGDPGFQLHVIPNGAQVSNIQFRETYVPDIGSPPEKTKLNRAPTGWDGSRYVMSVNLKTSKKSAQGSIRAIVVYGSDGLRVKARVRLRIEGRNAPPIVEGSGTQRPTLLKGGVSQEQIPGFVTRFHPGATEELETAGQQLAGYFVSPDPENEVASPVSNVSVDINGTLHYTLDNAHPSSSNYRYSFYLMARDTGEDHYDDGLCAANRIYGPFDERACSPPQKFSLVLGSHTGVNLAAYEDTSSEISAPPLRRQIAGASKGTPGSAFELDDAEVSFPERFGPPEPDPLTYRFDVSNLGGSPVSGARFETTSISGLRDVRWTCSTPLGSCTPASGTGPVNTRFDLGVGAGSDRARITLVGTPSAIGNFVRISSRASMPAGQPADSPTDTAVILQVVSPDGVFGSGFE